MAMVINSNIMSLNAQRNLTTAQAEQNQAMERLTSGKRINSAADDAAGLSIANRMTSQVNGLNQAVRNANDGVSMIQTAEGALDESTNILQRMRELSVQSANGTYTEGNRSTLNAEVQQLKAELDRISENTTFNGLKLLDGSQEDISLQVGADAGQTIDFSVSEVTTSSLGVSDEGGVTAQGTGAALSNGDLTINGVNIGASKAADDTASTVDASHSSISKAAAINAVSDQTGVTAIVDTNTVAGSTMTANAVTGQTLTINDVDITVDTASDNASTRASLVEAINTYSAQTGVTAVDTGDDALGITLEASDGRNISVALGGTLTEANTGLSEGTHTGSFTLVASAGTDSIEISGGDGTGNGDLANAGLTAGTYTAGQAATSSTERTASITPGDEATAAQITASGADYSQNFSGAATAATMTTTYGGAFDFSAADTAGTAQFGAIGASTYDFSGANAETFQISVDGGAAVDITIAQNVTSPADALAAMDQALQNAGIDSQVSVALGGGSGDELIFTSATTGAESSVTVSGVAGEIANTLKLENGAGTNGTTAGASGDTIAETMDVSVDGGPAVTLTFDTNITTIDQAQIAMQNALDDAGVTGITISNDGSDLTFTTTSTGADSDIVFTNVESNLQTVFGFGATQDATDGTGNAETFDISVDGGAAVTLTLDANITTQAEAEAELTQALSDAGVTGVTVGNDGSGNITLTSDATGSSESITLSNFGANVASTFGFTDGQTASGTNLVSDGTDALNTGDMVINDVAISAARASDDTASYADADTSNKAASGIAIAAAINASTDDTGVTATVNETELTGGTTTTTTTAGNTGAVWVNGVEVNLTAQASAEDSRTHAVEQINAVSGQTGVVATDNGESLTLTAQDGRNISIAIDTNAASGSGISGSDFGLDASVAGIAESDITAAGTGKTAADAAAETTYSTVSLQSAGAIELKGGTNGNDALEGLGFKAGTYGGGADGQLIKDVDVSTAEGASKAIDAIDNALEQVNDIRSELGAVNNRLDFTINNLSNVSENTAAARSRIEDADFAAESANLSRAQVLQQAGTAMLAQANAAPQQVLSLLQ